MMKTLARVAGLFAVYSAVGFGGDYAVGLLADDEVAVTIDREIAVEVDREIVVEVEREVEREVRVQVRRGGACAFEVDRELTLAASSGDVLEIDAGAGSLRVQGEEGLDEVRVYGVACSSEEAWLDDLRVTLDREGDRITLSAHYPDRSNFRGNNTARIDLTVSVPMGLDVDIDDSSGNMQVSGVGNLDIDDSSGSIQVTGAAGSVIIDDSSGSIQVEGSAGDVEIEDGSGGIQVDGVAGAVAVRDGSGGIDISNVAQDVLIEADGSGSIDVRNVAGDFVVGRDGSGGIRHSDVVGRVEIPERRRGR